MSRIIRVIIQNSSYQNKNREEVKNREIRYLPDLSIVNLLSVFVLVRRILNYYPTHRLYFREVETPYRSSRRGSYQVGGTAGHELEIRLEPNCRLHSGSANKQINVK